MTTSSVESETFRESTGQGSNGPVAAASTTARRRGPFWIGVGLIAGWILFLAVLTLTTANPVTLNPRQIRDSEFVVTGRVKDRYVIEATGNGQWPFREKSIGVENLPDTNAKIGGVYIFALTKVDEEDSSLRGDYFVTPSQLPNEAPLIYPVTPEALQQLEQILSVR